MIVTEDENNGLFRGFQEQIIGVYVKLFLRLCLHRKGENTPLLYLKACPSIKPPLNIADFSLNDLCLEMTPGDGFHTTACTVNYGQAVLNDRPGFMSWQGEQWGQADRLPSSTVTSTEHCQTPPTPIPLN